MIDGHKFDFNFFVLITSVDPLRVYCYDKNVLFRFCKLPYDPNNFTDPRSYVIDDEHYPGGEFKGFQKYVLENYSFKAAFEAIMAEMGHDTKKLYDQVEDCIRKVFMQKEHFMIKEIDRLKATNGKNHFFELFRFDFLVDAKLKVHLMEVNLSPNLYAVPKFRKNKKLYEAVVYNAMNLLGVGSYNKESNFRDLSDGEKAFICDTERLSVLPEVCIKKNCSESCVLPECELCWKCIPISLRHDMLVAYMEHMNIGEFKRVVPASIVSSNSSRVGCKLCKMS